MPRGKRNSNIHKKHSLKPYVRRKALLLGRRESTKKVLFISKAAFGRRTGIGFLKERILLNTV